MAVNKVVYGGNTLIDLSNDTLTNTDQLVTGATAHKADGKPVAGTNPYERTATDAEVSEQEELLIQAIAALAGKAAGGGDDLADNFITKNVDGTYQNDRVDVVGDYAFYKQTKLTSVNFPFVTNVGIQSFAECSSLQEASIPLATYIGSNAFLNCKVLKKAYYPLAENVLGYAFRNCFALYEAYMPLITVINDCAFDMPNGANNVLKNLDFPKVTSIKSYAFRNCKALTAIILRSNSIVTLGNVNAFNGSAVESGTGFVYVPAALVGSYKTATNWSTFANQFRALEDYTMDGTITGALDESKI